MNLVELPAGAPFGRLPFTVRHALAGHPLFTLPRLCALAAALPRDHVEWNVGELPVDHDPALTPANGLSPEETIRRISEQSSWLVLKYAERDPEVRDLLEACLRDVRRVSDLVEPGMCEPHAFIFVSSPGAVTPYHIDPEQNFLLQVRGHKRIHVWDPADRASLPEAELERFLGGGHRNLPFDPSFTPRARAFDLGAGQGVHVPVTAPHWVQNGPEPSVSFSITFRTRASLAREAAVKVNGMLRKMGVVPTPVGRSRLVDDLKSRGYEAARLVARAVRI